MGEPPERFSFDHQAGAFERRTGVPQEAARRTARDLVEALLPSPTDLLLDMGAGSGELGCFLAVSAPNYVGVDLSLPMLRAFQGKHSHTPFPLVQADADCPWPLRDGSVRAVLFSRSAHLMDLPHLLRELRRVAHPDGAWVVTGRVERDPMSMRSRLREQMLTLLAERLPDSRGVARRGAGPSAGRGRRRAQELEAALVETGAEVESPRVGGRWFVEDSLAGVLEDWRSKSGLAGRDVDAAVKHEVLSALEAWGEARFGTLAGDAETCERRFEWTPIRLPLPLSPY
ncbi:MAG: SAM-dependent methyltransferase [Chlamydiales bacterium]|jgi:SAM-dependent methyltransferase